MEILLLSQCNRIIECLVRIVILVEYHPTLVILRPLFLWLSLMLIAFFTSDRQLMPSPITCMLADVSRNDVK